VCEEMAKRRRRGSNRRKRLKLSKKGQRVIRGTAFVLVLLFSTIIYRFFSSSSEEIIHSFDHPLFSKKYLVRGVDVSHHNSYINWSQLRKENITFVYLKSTEGTSHNDREYKKNYRLAREAGLRVGSYHFYTFGRDGQKQASHFIRHSTSESGDMIPAIDVEHSPFNRPCNDKESYSKMIRELRILENALFKHYGKRPVIYTNKECYRMYIKDNFRDNPLWICDLDNEPGSDYKNWVIWQFSHKGKIAGVEEIIDLNYYRHSFDDFKKMLLP
jgi:lysozyme